MRSLSQRAGPLAIFDFLLMIGCYVLSAYLLVGNGAGTYLIYENGLAADVLTAGGVLILFYFQGLYDARRRRAGFDLALRLMTGLGLAFLLEAALFYLKKDLALPLSFMVFGSTLTFILLLLSRFIYYGLLSGRFGPERILLVGATPVNRAIAARIQARPEFGYAVAGFLDDAIEPGAVLEGVRVLGPASALADVRRTVHYQRAIADFSGATAPLSLMNACGLPGSLEKPDALYELLFARVCGIQPADVLFGVEFAPPRAKMALQTLYANLLALASLAALSPLMLAIAAGIRVLYGGPVLETQLTAGWRLTPFTRFRFRCYEIVRTADGERRRLTRLGAWLQRLRLDHLPQLLNVLRGEMALVGPPPLRVEFANSLIEALPHYRLAYTVKPGLVSWSRLNNAADAVTALRYDLYYVKSISPSLDFSMLLQAFSQPRYQP